MSKNDVTGDHIRTKLTGQENYRAGFDRIFGRCIDHVWAQIPDRADAYQCVKCSIVKSAMETIK